MTGKTKMYKSEKPKIVDSIEEIAHQIADNDMLVFGYVHAGFEPLFEKLAECNLPRNIRFFILSTLGYREGDIFPLGKVCNRLNAQFVICQLAPQFANVFEEGPRDILPLPFSLMPRYLNRESRSRRLWLFPEVNLPDDKGFCNTGYTAPFPLSLYENCRVVGLVNEKLSSTYGDTSIPAKVFDYFIRLPGNRLPLYPEPPITEALDRIGLNVAELVEEGSTIEVGVGSIASSVLRSLSNKRKLRIWSGFLLQDVRRLVETEVVTDKCTCHCAGAYSPDFYDWLGKNPEFEFRTLEYTHNIQLMCQQPNFTAINSAISVDLLGQIVSETIGLTQITGLGGALDFARGATLSGGKSIIALQSVYGKGRKSTIVPFLENGSVVSLTRYDVDYVVTEHGIAELRYKTKRERTLNLINVAHPDHRGWLRESATKLKLI